MAFKPNKVNWHFALLLWRQSYFNDVRTSSIQFTTSDYPRDLSGIVPTGKVFLFIDSGRGGLEAHPPNGTKRVNVNSNSLLLNIKIKFYVIPFVWSLIKNHLIYFVPKKEILCLVMFLTIFPCTHLHLHDKDFYPYFSMQYGFYKIV